MDLNRFKRRLYRDQADEDKTEVNRFVSLFPPGHFYSPIPNVDIIKSREQEIFENTPSNLPGIHLNEKRQIELFNKFTDYYDEIPFRPEKNDELRYFFENPSYSYTDAIFLYSMIRHVKPKRIIEIGSGYSSCVTLDTNEIFFGNSISCTFIDPNPELLQSLIKKEDEHNIELINSNLQDVDISNFSNLSRGDILFVDSTHISKIDSDVNRILFEILPCIERGIHIHFHDIFYPFEYPKVWVYEGRAWNEAYLLRAFLQYNTKFEIEIFSDYLAKFHRYLYDSMPLCLKNTGGDIWIEKT